MEMIPKVLKNITIGDSVTHENLRLLPLMATETGGGAEYLTLKEAVETGQATVREVSEGGSVPELLFESRSDFPVLIVDGEELVGAKQNRTINLTVLVPPKSKTLIPVSCVEAGRWRYESSEFQVSERAHFAQGRAAKVASVSDSLHHSGSRRSDQGRVWSDISYAAQQLSAPSPTRAMGAIFDRHRASIEDYVGAFDPLEDQVGALFAVGRRISGFDLFDHPSTLSVMLPKLVRSYAVEALGVHPNESRRPGRKRAAAFLARVAEAEVETYPGVGLGTDVRLTGRHVVAGGLVHDDRLVHLAAFATSDASSHGNGGRGRGMASIRGRRRSVRNR